MNYLFEFVPPKQASVVVVTGSFDNWSQSAKMEPSENGIFYKTLQIPVDVSVSFKFIVDGEWMCDDSKQKVDDGNGNINNVLFVSSEKIISKPIQAKENPLEKVSKPSFSSLQTIDAPVVEIKQTPRKWWHMFWRSKRTLE
jgi:hypothetical protein